MKLWLVVVLVCFLSSVSIGCCIGDTVYYSKLSKSNFSNTYYDVSGKKMASVYIETSTEVFDNFTWLNVSKGHQNNCGWKFIFIVIPRCLQRG